MYSKGRTGSYTPMELPIRGRRTQFKVSSKLEQGS